MKSAQGKSQRFSVVLSHRNSFDYLRENHSSESEALRTLAKIISSKRISQPVKTNQPALCSELFPNCILAS